MGRYAIALFLLLLLGAAVEEQHLAAAIALGSPAQ